jgi:hypothetical protein
MDMMADAAKGGAEAMEHITPVLRNVADGLDEGAEGAEAAEHGAEAAAEGAEAVEHGEQAAHGPPRGFDDLGDEPAWEDDWPDWDEEPGEAPEAPERAPPGEAPERPRPGEEPHGAEPKEPTLNGYRYGPETKRLAVGFLDDLDMVDWDALQQPEHFAHVKPTFDYFMDQLDEILKSAELHDTGLNLAENGA